VNGSFHEASLTRAEMEKTEADQPILMKAERLNLMEHRAEFLSENQVFPQEA
jgi:hypothetical protein